MGSPWPIPPDDNLTRGGAIIQQGFGTERLHHLYQTHPHQHPNLHLNTLPYYPAEPEPAHFYLESNCGTFTHSILNSPKNFRRKPYSSNTPRTGSQQITSNINNRTHYRNDTDADNNNNSSKYARNRGKDAISVREIPTWSIYYNDQRLSLAQFVDKGNIIRPDYLINKCVSLCFDDVCITNLGVDAVVTSTNSAYGGESGVDKRIHEEAGKNLKETCNNLPDLEVGSVEITQGFNLPSKYVIHTNGPQTDSPEKLKACYENSLNLLVHYKLRTIALPCISTGKKGFNRKLAAITALSTVRNFIENNQPDIDRIVFSLHNPKDITIYRRFMQIYFPVDPEPEL